MWLPTAKTKMFRVPVRPVLPKEEKEEIQHLYNYYKTYMKSMRKYMQDVYERNQVFVNQEALDKEFEEDYAKSYKLNVEWNKAVAEIRKVKEVEQMEELETMVMQQLLEKEQEEARLREEAEEKIRQLKKEVATLFTDETIDEAITAALATTVNYNKAIDPKGVFCTEENPLEKENLANLLPTDTDTPVLNQ